MTYDGLNDVHMEYNAMDLVRKVTRGSEVLVNYSYLADGTKLSALDVDGEGLVYRGPFVYRQSSGGEGNSDEVVVEYAWTDASSQNELDEMGVQGTYLGEAVVIFNGYYHCCPVKVPDDYYKV